MGNNNRLNQFINVPGKNETGGVVYFIQNLNNGKMYIGKTQNYNSRINHHVTQLARGNHRNEKLQEDYNNGDKFLIGSLYRVYCGELSGDLLAAKEWEYITEFQTVEHGYNVLGKPPKIIKENNMEYLRNEYIAKEEEGRIKNRLEETKQLFEKIRKEERAQSKKKLSVIRQSVKERDAAIKNLERVKDYIDRVSFSS